MSESLLPTRQYKRWNTSNPRLKKENHQPLSPYFCPCKDPETSKKCGKYLDEWDALFFNQYGMCADCVKKYNAHIEDINKKVDEITEEAV